MRAPTVLIAPTRGLFDLDLKAVWDYRELLYFMVWRDVKVRYKQTVIGVAWVVLQPLLTMILFTVIFGYLARIPSDGLPYPLFAYTALLPWTYFSQALTRSGGGLVGNANLISKVYFPRLIIPLSSVVVPVVDLLLCFVILLGLMIWYGVAPTWGVLALPLFLLLALMTALAVGLLLSPLHVKYRDVGYVVPFLVQFWMFASPVIYPVSLVPEQWRLLYSLNPMVGVIEGFRWALLGKESPDFRVMSGECRRRTGTAVERGRLLQTNGTNLRGRCVMGDIAIRVETLSKQYRIEATKYRHDTLRDQLVDGLKSLFRSGRPALSVRRIRSGPSKTSPSRSNAGRSSGWLAVTVPGRARCSKSSPASRSRLSVEPRFTAGLARFSK